MSSEIINLSEMSEDELEYFEKIVRSMLRGLPEDLEESNQETDGDCSDT